MANVERLNYTLGRLLNGYMNQKEIETGEEYKEWSDILNTLRDELNKVRNIKPDKDPFNYKFPEVKTNSKFKVDDVIYYKSEIPLSALGYKQPTDRFRVGDYRYMTLER